jgi:hypothetical protein
MVVLPASGRAFDASGADRVHRVTGLFGCAIFRGRTSNPTVYQEMPYLAAMARALASPACQLRSRRTTCLFTGL